VLSSMGDTAPGCGSRLARRRYDALGDIPSNKPQLGAARVNWSAPAGAEKTDWSGRCAPYCQNLRRFRRADCAPPTPPSVNVSCVSSGRN